MFMTLTALALAAHLGATPPAGRPGSRSPASPTALPDTTVLPLAVPAEAAVDTFPIALVDLRPEQGPLPTQLKREVAKALAAGLTPFVELGGSGCPPCRTLRGMLHYDKHLIDAFQGTYIIGIDYALWSDAQVNVDRVLGLEGVSTRFPAFVPLTRQGKGIRQVMMAGTFDVNSPIITARLLKDFFQ